MSDCKWDTSTGSFFNEVSSVIQNTVEIRIPLTKELKSEHKIHVDWIKIYLNKIVREWVCPLWNSSHRLEKSWSN